MKKRILITIDQTVVFSPNSIDWLKFVSLHHILKYLKQKCLWFWTRLWIRVAYKATPFPASGNFATPGRLRLHSPDSGDLLDKHNFLGVLSSKHDWTKRVIFPQVTTILQSRRILSHSSAMMFLKTRLNSLQFFSLNVKLVFIEPLMYLISTYSLISWNLEGGVVTF